MSAASDHAPLVLVGCDFRIASTAWRGALVLSPDERGRLHERLASAARAPGLAVLETCNRTEWIVEAPQPEWAGDLLRAWMVRRWRERFEGTMHPEPYVHVGEAAARHFIRVAVGLESFVPGEREIAGQCRRAISAARDERTSTPLLDALGSSASRAVRRVDLLPSLRESARGVPGLAVDALAAPLAGLGRPAVVAVAGMGLIGRKVAALLAQRPGTRVVAFNRTIPPEQADRWRPLTELHGALPDVDALVVTTGAAAPTVEIAAGADGRPAPRVVLDLGNVPQVRVAPGAGARVLGLDDLLRGPARAIAPQAMDAALESVETGVVEFMLSWRKRSSAPLLAAVQRTRRRTQEERLPSVLDEHLDGLDPSRRRRLEAAIRGLMRDHHRDLLDEIDRAARTGSPRPAPAGGGPTRAVPASDGGRDVVPDPG